MNAYSQPFDLTTTPSLNDELLAFIEKLTNIPNLDLEDTATEAMLDWIETEAVKLVAKAKGQEA